MTTIVKDRLFNISKSATIDEKYGPYASELDANTKLSSQDAITVGLTVGITQSDGSIKEYWYQPDGQGGLQLVEKQVAGGTEVEANPTGEATTPLNKIKIGETNYNIPQTDTSNLATKQELQQGLSGKQDIISDLQQIRTRADEGHTALQPIQDATPNNFVIFDENGGIKDSGCNEGTFIKGVKQNGDLITPVSGVVDVTVQDGKSALQIYNETYGTNLNEAQFIDILKQNYPMEYVAYDQTAAGQSIGTGFSEIGTLTADSTTADKMYLMPNSSTTPTGTILFVTVQTGTSTYEWYKLGDLDVPSNVLTQTNIVNDLITGGATNVLSAEQGKIFREILLPINIPSDIINANCSWCSLGTSITWYNDNLSHGITKGYQSRVLEHIKFNTFQNKGINGGRMGSKTGIVGLGDNLSTIPYADLYTIEYGINDWMSSIPVGSLDDYINNNGTSTFYGAYRRVIDYIYSLNIDAKIILCTPRKGYDFNGSLPQNWYEPKNGIYLRDYVDAVFSIASFESLIVCDWFSECQASQKTLVNYSIDTALHPNDKGFERMSELLVSAMKKMFMNVEYSKIIRTQVFPVLGMLESGGSAFRNATHAFIGPCVSSNSSGILRRIISNIPKDNVYVDVCVINPLNPTDMTIYEHIVLINSVADVRGRGIVVPSGYYVGFANILSDAYHQQVPLSWSTFNFDASAGTQHWQHVTDEGFVIDKFPTFKMTLGYELEI